jgi:hypothetical protein
MCPARCIHFDTKKIHFNTKKKSCRPVTEPAAAPEVARQLVAAPR